VKESTLSRRISEFLGVALFAMALIWLISLVTHDPADPVWFFTTGTGQPPVNFVGRVGAFLSELSFQLFGYAAFLIPAAIGVAGWHYFWCQKPEAPYTKLTGTGLLFLASSAFLSLVFGDADAVGKTFYAGGSTGSWLGSALSAYLNRTGSLIVLTTLIILAAILSTQFSLGRMFATASVNSKELSSRGAGWLRGWWDDRRRERARREVIAKQTRKAAARDDEADGDAPATGARSLRVARPPAGEPSAATAGSRQTPLVAQQRRPETAPLPLAEPELKGPAQRRQGTFTLPPMTLLDAPKAESKIDERELMESARQLEEKCREFAVEGQVAQIHPGPVVTTFEFKPEAGVKYSKVTGLADDLCLAMQAESVLIDRIPGKSTVGIQIPNPNREAISLRELLESDAYQRSPSKLTLALGKTIHGEPYLADLATMPHLLIAGSTGTGKSVGLNAMLTSLLYRATPDEVRFIMIDPKRLELGMYEEIPHLLSPVVVDPKKAANALRWAVREMEERYKTLAAEGVRNIEQYNRNIRHVIAERGSADAEAPKLLPFVVVVIDELADLMMVASNEVEESICRLAQMARAVGIHLILATQRPSVDVITGLIKANLPSRISFRVSSKTDSRTILDGNGAEQLLGKGDMLFLPPASSRAIRLHGPYISEQESARLASFLRKQGKPIFDETITAEDEAKTGPGGLEFEKDELYDEASRIVVTSGQVSISYLQRKLRIGFSRAARLVDMMEADGLVSPGAGGKPREVLVDRGYFEEVDAQLR
jgi:S-DNA-T family DNA segregation ATPase FtsK/SpoIIIE